MTRWPRPALRAEVDGVDLAVYREGRGPPVLMPPLALGVSAELLLDAVGPARKYATMVSFDPPGVGASGPPRAPEQATAAGVARLARGLLAALDLRDVTLLGHANGALAGMRLLAEGEPRIARAALVAAYAHGRMPRYEPADHAERAALDAFRAGWRRLASGEASLDEVRAFMLLSPSVYASQDGGAALVLEELMKRESPETLRERLPAAAREIATTDLRPLLPKIAVPCWVVAGVEDAVAPLAMSEEIARLVPDARLSRYKDASHFPFFEKPAVFHRHFRDFVQRGAFPRSAVRPT